MKYSIGLLAFFYILSSFATDKTVYTRNYKTNYCTETTETGIKFHHGTWAEALEKAKAENKLIFLDAYASWCGPCKIMARTTFQDEEVGLFFNKHFVNVKMDMEKDPEGPRLSKKYKLTAYPTLYFIDSNEKIIRYEIGWLKSKPFLKLGKAVIANK